MKNHCTTDHLVVSGFVELLVLHGIKKVVSSPGSRNAPFIIALSAKQNHIEILNITDERSAAFFALGMAQALKFPVALLCTSGTAVLNYAPAIAEAFYQNIPLIIISADRPESLINQAESQTIMQHKALNNHVLKSYNFQVLRTLSNIHFYNRLMNEAIILAKNKSKPVHLNFHLEEPLYNKTIVKNHYFRKIEFIAYKRQIDVKIFRRLAEKFNKSKKIMILGGSHYPCRSLQTILGQLFNKCDNAILLVENITNITDKDSITSIDRVITTFSAEEIRDYKPDILITFGGILVSRLIKNFLRKNKPKEHWQITLEENLVDSYDVLNKQIPLSPKEFFTQLIPFLHPIKSNYKNLWLTKNKRILNNHTNFIKSCKWSDLKAFKFILNHIPKNSILQLGNSTVVRYSQLFEPMAEIKYFSNRGTSGIEGSISTAIGSNYISGKLTTAIVGDLSFLYDSNALWNNFLRSNFKLIIINNGGGGIFRFIDGPSDTNYLEEFFEASHNYSFKNFAKQFNITYYLADNEKVLKQNLKKMYTNNCVEILEVKTPRNKNALILKDYFENLKT